MSKPSKKQDLSYILAKSDPHALESPNQLHNDHIPSSHAKSPFITYSTPKAGSTSSTANVTRMDGVWNLGMVPSVPQSKQPSSQPSNLASSVRPRSTTVTSIDSLSIKPISAGHSSGNNLINTPTLNVSSSANVQRANVGGPSVNNSTNSTNSGGLAPSSGLGIASGEDQRSINSMFVSTRNNSALSFPGLSLTLEIQPLFNHDNGSQMSDGNTMSSGPGNRLLGSGTSSMGSLAPIGIPNSSFPDIELTQYAPAESPTFVFSDLVNLFNSNKDEYTLVSKGNDIIGLLNKYPHLQNDLQLSKVLPKLCFLMYHKSLEVRAVGFKVVRYLVGNTNDLSIMIVYGKLLIFLIRTLSVSKSTFIERLELLKLIRKIMFLPPNGVDYLSIGVVKALINLIRYEIDMEPTASSTSNVPLSPQNKLDSSSDEENQFLKLKIETICEITLLKPQLSFYSGGFSFLLQCVIDSGHIPVELSVVCVEVIVKLLDWKFSRKYLRNGLDLNLIVLIFSSCADEEDPAEMTSVNDGKRRRKSMPPTGIANHNTGAKRKRMSSGTVSQLQRSSALITMILKNFNGVICFVMNDGFILGNLLANLRRRNNKVKELILDILFDVLLLRPLPWAKSCPIAEWMGKYQARAAGLKTPKQEQVQYQQIPKFYLSHSLTNHYVGLLTLVLIRLGIIDMLSTLIAEEKSNYILVEKLTDLLSHILRLGTDLVPPELLNDQLIRHRASNATTVYKLDGFIHKLQSFGISSSSKLTQALQHGTVKAYISDHVKAQKQVNFLGRLNISNEEFKAMIVGTRVLEIKKYEDWNLTLLIQLVEGPLRNPKRFDEIVEKNPKFLKRIVSFYRPFKFRFCNMPINSRHRDTFIALGCLLLETFLQVVPQGVKYLANNKVMAQLSEIMAQIDPYSGITARDPIFSRKRLENNLGFGYLQFIGVLSQYDNGISILESWQFINILNDIVDYSQLINRNNYFLWNLFMFIDLTQVNTPFRIIFAKLMTGANIKLRLKIMEKIIAPKLLMLFECQHYICELLVELLMDPNNEIIEKLIEFLDILLNEIVDTDEFLDYFISLRPSIRILNKSLKGQVLLLKCLGCAKGFQYLKQLGYVDKELNENWNMDMLDSFRLLGTIERLIQHLVSPILRTHWTKNVDASFITQLLNTEEGLVYFRSKRQHMIQVTLMEIYRLAPLAIDKDELATLKAQDEFARCEILSSGRSDVSPTKSIHQTLPKSSLGANITGKDEHDDLYTKPHELARLKQNLWLIGLIASSKYGIELIDPMGSSHIWSHTLMEPSPPTSPHYANSNSAATTPTTTSRRSSVTTKSNGNNGVSSINGNIGTFTPLKSISTPSGKVRSRASTIAQEVSNSSPLAVMIDLFHECSIWQIKLCCFYVLGMVALTAEGMEMLDEFGWISVIDNYNMAQGYCYPSLDGTISLFHEEDVNPYDEGIMDDMTFRGDEESNGLFLSDETETAITPSDTTGSAAIGTTGSSAMHTLPVPVPTLNVSGSLSHPVSRTIGNTTPVPINNQKDIYDHQIFTEVTRAPKLTIAHEEDEDTSHEYSELVGMKDSSDLAPPLNKFEPDEGQMSSEIMTPTSPRPELNEEELEDKFKKRVISLILYMNSVLNRIERKCKKELLKLKALIPDLFENSDLFLEVIKLIDKGNYSFLSRNFIFCELFNEDKIYESLLKSTRRIRQSTI